MHARARPPAAALYGALLAHTVISAANYLFAKRALMAQEFLGEHVTLEFFVAAGVVIAGVLLAQWRVSDAAEEALLESPAKT